MAISTSNSSITGISGAASAISQSSSICGPGYLSVTAVNSGGIITNSAGAYKIGSALDVNGSCSISGELTVDGISIKQQLEKINERLAILVPDPALLAKYEILKNLYSQYKMAEALCKNNEPK